MRKQGRGTCKRTVHSIVTGADPGFFLVRDVPLRNDVTDWWREQIFKSEYKEEGFWLHNNIMWTAENTYHTYLHILQNTSCIRKAQVISEGEGVRTPYTLPLDPPPPSPSQQYLLFSALWIISAFFSSSSSGLSRATTIPSSWSSSPSGVIIKFSRVTCS